MLGAGSQEDQVASAGASVGIANAEEFLDQVGGGSLAISAAGVLVAPLLQIPKRAEATSGLNSSVIDGRRGRDNRGDVVRRLNEGD